MGLRDPVDRIQDRKEKIVGVLIRAFYWDCPMVDRQEFQWWHFIAIKFPELEKAGITALWPPPATTAANIGGISIGYDVRDYCDLGADDQTAQ
jgi:alpha-amylase